MASYTRTQRMTLLGTIAFTAVLLIIVGFAGRWALNAAFRPVSRMTAEAEAWSTEDLDRRFEMGEPHDEVTQLAHTLDGMLDRLAASLRREQRFSAEVSHQLRTPVAKIKTEAELALRRERDPEYYQEALGSVLHSADQMARTVETLLAAAQEEGSLARGPGRCLAGAGGRGELHRCVGRRARGGGEGAAPASRSARGSGARYRRADPPPVVENACRFAKSRGASESLPQRQGGVLPRGGRWSGSDRRRRRSGSSSPGCGAALPRRRPTALAAPGWGYRWPGAWPGRPPATWRSDRDRAGAQFVVRLPSG